MSREFNLDLFLEDIFNNKNGIYVPINKRKEVNNLLIKLNIAYKEDFENYIILCIDYLQPHEKEDINLAVRYIIDKNIQTDFVN